MLVATCYRFRSMHLITVNGSVPAVQTRAQEPLRPVSKAGTAVGKDSSFWLQYERV